MDPQWTWPERETRKATIEGEETGLDLANLLVIKPITQPEK